MKKLNTDINYYFKKIGTFPSGRPRLAVDYKKLLETEFTTFLIITERGVRVKTFGAKELILSKWNGNKPNCLWLRTKVDEAEAELSRFLIDTPLGYENFKFRGKDLINQTTKNQLLTIEAVNSPSVLRGSRVLSEFVIWDEFNNGVSGFNFKTLTDNFIDILGSTTNSETESKQKVFLLGNNKSFYHPVLIKLGITSIKQQVSPIYTEEGVPLLLIIFPIISSSEKKDIEKENKDNPRFQLIKKMGGIDHNYFNENQLDNLNGIVNYNNVFKKLIFFPEQCLKNKLGKLYAFYVPVEFRKNSSKIWFISKELLKEKIPFPPSFSTSNVAEKDDIVLTSFSKQKLLDNYVDGEYAFADISSKNIFMKMIS